ncbi:MAG: hypothetical protein KatS3mg076_2235 [Candidatus Binatia bacterium]|nr:MAG: hypothetical protein KatS3mg076_2235 [Candidatus Binatia bacterium]
MEDRWTLADLNYHEALREQARLAGGTVHEEAGMTFTLGPHPHPVANTAFRTLSSAPARTLVERALAFYAEHRHSFGLLTRDHPADSDLAEAARRCGLVPMATPPEMIATSRIGEKPPPPDSEFRRVADRATLGDFAEVAGRAWATYGVPPEVPRLLFVREESLGFPHVFAVVGYWRGEPVSGALAVLSHGIAGVYWVSTVPEARGRGFGEAATRWVTNAAFDAGARWVSLQASPMGEKIYRRMGFVEIGRYRLFLGPEL